MHYFIGNFQSDDNCRENIEEEENKFLTHIIVCPMTPRGNVLYYKILLLLNSIPLSSVSLKFNFNIQGIAGLSVN